MSAEPSKHHEIGLVACVAFAVGTMVGGGVFTLSGTAVDQSGVASITAYLLAGVVMLLCALSFVVVSSRATAGKSGYDPIGEVLGTRWRFLVMWAFWLSAVCAVAFVLISFGTYLQQYFLEDISVTAGGVAALIALVLLNLGPSDLVGRAETLLVVVKIAILMVLIAYGLAALSGNDLTQFEPTQHTSLAVTTAMLFTAYTGFNVITNMAGSVHDPARTVPRAILLSILIAAVLYVGVIVALLASGVQEFGADGLGKAATALMGHNGALLVAFAACISTLSAANANVLGSSELVIRLTAQGDLPPVLGRTTQRGHAYVSVLAAGAIAAVLVIIGNTDSVISLSNVTAIVAMVIVCVAAAKIAHGGWQGDGMKLPGGMLIPILGAFAAAVQVLSLGWTNVAISAALLLAGFAVFVRRDDQRRGETVVADLEHRIHHLETPVARALRRGGTR